MTHICVSKLTSIGSDNALSPGRRQAIIWTKAGILSNGPLEINFSEIVNGIHLFSLKKNTFENVVWKMVAILFRPQCVKVSSYLLMYHKRMQGQYIFLSPRHPVISGAVNKHVLWHQWVAEKGWSTRYWVLSRSRIISTPGILHIRWIYIYIHYILTIIQYDVLMICTSIIFQQTSNLVIKANCHRLRCNGFVVVDLTSQGGSVKLATSSWFPVRHSNIE